MFFLSPFNRSLIKNNNNLFDFVDGFFNDSFFNPSNSSFKTDIKENDNAYLIEAELPGINKEDIQLEYRDQNLIISVQQETKQDEEKENYIHKERRTTSMKRSFYLGDVNNELIEAKLENGVLKVLVPKNENKDIRFIEIK